MPGPTAQKSTAGRWFVLAMVCTMMWGIYFNPLSKHLSLSAPEFSYLLSTLYTVYAAPNIVLPLLSGPAVYLFGERKVLLATAASIVSGQLCFSLAVQVRSPLGLIAGRALIGLGGEIAGVLGNEITTRWFRGKEISLALALNLGISRLGSVANSLSIPRLTKAYGVVSATWMGTVLSLATIVLGAVSLVTATRSVGPPASKPKTKSVVSLSQFPLLYWQLGLVCLLGYGGINTFTNSAQRFLASQYYEGDQNKAGATVSITYILSAVLVPLFGLLLDLPSFSNCPHALITTNFLLAVAHALFLSSTSPILPLCVLGVAFALYGAAFWAALGRCLVSPTQPGSSTRDQSSDRYEPISSQYDAAILPNPEEEQIEYRESQNENHPEDLVALGFGIMTSLVNLSTAIMPLILTKAEIVGGFSGTELVFLLLAVLGFAVSSWLSWTWEF